MEQIINAISTVGFPIVACAGLFYLYDKTIKDLTVALTKIDQTQQLIVELIKEKKDDEQC